MLGEYSPSLGFHKRHTKKDIVKLEPSGDEAYEVDESNAFGLMIEYLQTIRSELNLTTR